MEPAAARGRGARKPPQGFDFEHQTWPLVLRAAAEMLQHVSTPMSPAENLGRMLALLDAKILRLQPSSKDANKTIEIDAVLASPHQWPDDSPLCSLMRDGWIQRLPGGQGVVVDRCGRPRRADGRTALGLAVLGRVTEGCIIGNDTLSRTLHRHCDRWAYSLLKQLQRKPLTT